MLEIPGCDNAQKYPAVTRLIHIKMVNELSANANTHINFCSNMCIVMNFMYIKLFYFFTNMLKADSGIR